MSDHHPHITEPGTMEDASKAFIVGAETLKLLAEPTRLHLLSLLCRSPHTVGELVSATGAPRTVVSQHLAKLRIGNLVTSRKSGRNVIYSVTDGHLSRLVKQALSHADHVISGEPHHP